MDSKKNLDLFKKFVSTIDYNKLDLIRTSLTPDNLEEWLLKAKSLSRSDLKTELKKFLGRLGMIKSKEILFRPK